MRNYNVMSRAYDRKTTGGSFTPNALLPPRLAAARQTPQRHLPAGLPP